MSDIRSLYQLQSLDLELEFREATLQDVNARRAGWPELEEARALLTEGRRRLAQAQTAQRAQQREVDGLHLRRDEAEKKLYGGTIRNPRELTGLQQDFWHLQERCRQQEDRLLELMLAAEEAQSQVASQQERVTRLEAQWSTMVAELDSAAERLAQEIAQLQIRRGALTGAIAPASLSRYRILRPHGNGRAVARIEQNRCQECRIELPSSLVQQARQDRELVQCESCGRLLYSV